MGKPCSPNNHNTDDVEHSRLSDDESQSELKFRQVVAMRPYGEAHQLLEAVESLKINSWYDKRNCVKNLSLTVTYENLN